MKSVDRIADTCAHTGEGTLWHPEERALYWDDIPVGQLYSYDPVTDYTELVYKTNEVPLSRFTIGETVPFCCSLVMRFSDLLLTPTLHRPLQKSTQRHGSTMSSLTPKAECSVARCRTTTNLEASTG